MSTPDREWMDHVRDDLKVSAIRLADVLYEIICRIESLCKRIEKLEESLKQIEAVMHYRKFFAKKEGRQT